MKQVFALLNEMVRDGALANYAVAGAVGAMFYVEPFSTQDIDVLVMTPEDRLVIELPGLAYLKARGYTEFRNEGIVIQDWPVQFLPAMTQLEREAYLNAEISNLDEVPVRVVLPEHLVAIMLSVGRPKDLARVEMFLSQDAVKIDALEDLIQRHRLTEKLADYKRKFAG